MPLFTTNYPAYQPGKTTLLSTPERTGSLPEFTGRGVVMAFVDAGFYPHPDLKARIRVHVDATTDTIHESRGNNIPVVGGSWHGQMTSVIACGDGTSSEGRYRGIASRAEVVLIKISSPTGAVKEADILRGLKWLVQHHARFHVRVVNLSVGGDFVSTDPKHPLHMAVRQLAEAGVVVVCAAGNNPDAAPVPPASAPEALVVGGYDDRNSLDRGQWSLYHHTSGTAWDQSHKPDIIAPAAWIASPFLPETPTAREARWLAKLLETVDFTGLRGLLLDHWDELGIPRRTARRPDAHLMADLQKRIYQHKIVDSLHQYVDGTSVSTAIVSSIVAQIIEANPRLTPAQIREILTSTAHPLPHAPLNRQGAGIINAASAVRHAQLITR